MTASRPDTGFPTLLQQFFLDRLIQQRNASPQTIASYRDTFRLLLQFAQKHLHKPPERLTLTELDAPLVLAFLQHLERERHNSIRSRNARLAAVRAFMHYAALKELTALPTIQSVLAIPMKRCEKRLVGYLSQSEVQAVLNAPDAATWCGQRDRVMLATLYNTGARVSELIGLRVRDLTMEHTASVRIRGKGRKERWVPLWRTTAAQIRRWLPQISSSPDQPLFPNRAQGPMTRSAVRARLKLALDVAVAQVSQLANRPISPHTFRHTTAMHMLQAGVDITVIALWLGHESPTTTHMYVEADLAMKERAIGAVQPPPHNKQIRYRPTDRVMQFLQAL